MRFLADENFPGPAIAALAHDGHDIVSVAEISAGMLDADIFAWAVREQRIVLTYDKDFGEISRRTPASAFCGVILFRRPMPPLASVGAYVTRLLKTRSDWIGYFSVVSGDRVRRRPLIVD